MTTTTTDLVLSALPRVEGLIGQGEHDLLGDLILKLESKRARNRLRRSYYDMREKLKNLGIGMPDVPNLEAVLGWPALAVDSMADRITLERFTLPDGGEDEWGIPDLADENRLDVDLPMAVQASLLHSFSSIMTSLGDVGAGEPEVLISSFDAESSTGRWRPTIRGLDAGLVVQARDEFGQPSDLVFFPRPGQAYQMRRTLRGWDVRGFRFSLPRVPLEVLPYRPRHDRPFGVSRINRGVMYWTDAAVRAVSRAELHAEVFLNPQRYLLGAGLDAFTEPDGTQANIWKVAYGRVLAIPDDEDATNPRVEFGQFPQASMQPHTEHLRSIAAFFAAETYLPLDSLGIVQDNPSSAEARDAAKENIALASEKAIRGFKPALHRTMVNGILMRDNLTEVPPELRRLGTRWRSTATPSQASATDSVLKLTTAGILPPDSDVALEMIGLDDDTIARVQSDRTRERARASLDLLAARARADVQAEVPVSLTPKVVPDAVDG